MADDQTSQQTRVLLVNGRTVILQGDAGDTSINEINADLLQQALQEVSTTAEDPVEDTNDEYNAPIPESEDTNDNLVAIFQGDQGETHTIHLTVEQAEALGLHFSMDSDDKPIQSDLSEHASNSNLYITDEPNTHLVYSEDIKPSSNEVMFESELNPHNSCSDVVQSNRNIENNNEHGLETSEESLGMLSSSVNTFINEQNQPVTLIPQYVGGQMTYTVKIQEDEDDTLLENREFTNMDSEMKCVNTSVSLHQTNAIVTLNNITSFASSPLSSVSCSVSSNTSLSSIQSVPSTTLPPISSVQESVSLPVSVTPVQQAVTLPVSSVTQSISVPNTSLQETLSLNNFHCSRTNSANISQDNKTKVSYVILPGSNTSTSSSVSTKFNAAPLARLSTSFIPSSRQQSLINSNNVSTALKTATTLPLVHSSSSSSQILQGSTTGFTSIAPVSSNVNIMSSSSILPVAATSGGGGMIRVMAGSTLNNNTTKFTSVLPQTSGRLVGASGNVTTVPKIVSINPSSVNKVPTTATPEVTNMVSAALTRMPVSNFNSTKPLGSSENPIQLVQHGQTFHSVQSLTQEQLRQIATVLQQQHLESAPRTKNVVYDAETNTRIIYRVVYPEDLDLRDPRSPDNKGGGQNVNLSSSSRGRGRRGRPPKSNLRGHGRGVDSGSGRRTGVSSGSVDMDFDEDRLILDDSAKGEKKKQLARTRSGRLSRPPRHMVKDYKRLHHLDFADADLDDSDGGYSDYQMSEHEAEDPPEKTDGKELLPGLAVPKRKISSHFRCPTCQKIYLGYSRMSRHFEMYPDHGSIEQMQMPNQTNTNNNSIEDRTAGTIDSNESTKVAVPVPGSGLNGIVRTGSTKRRGKRRGPWAYATPEARSQRRKGKLREVLATCEASELAEVAGPAVAGVLSLWDLLLLRVEAVRAAEESYVVTLCEELQVLLEKLRAVANEIFKPLDMKTEKDRQFELQDELLCTTFGVASGTYIVDDTKLQHPTSVEEATDGPLQKRMRLELPEGDDKIENLSTNCESAVTETGSVMSDIKGKPETQCPEVLSALTLMAKPSESQKSECDTSHLPARTSENEDETKVMDVVEKSEDFLLSSESNDICRKLASENDEHVGDSSGRLEQNEHAVEFSNSDHHSQELETVDDIVNERLKNLTSGSSLVDFSVAAPINVSNCMTTSSIDIPKSSIISSQDLIDRLGQFRPLPLSNDVTSNEVSSFDPEIALAAMGEGEQDAVSASSQHFDSALQQIGTVPSDSGSSFDPEVALGAMGEGEQSSSIESQRNPFQPNRTSFTPEDALAAMGEGEQNPVEDGAHGQFQNTLPEINNIADARQSFDPEIALAAMGEGNEVTNDGACETENGFQSTLDQIRMNNMSANAETFDPEVALAAMGEGTSSSVNEVQNQFSSGGNTSGNVHSYNTAMELHDIGNDGSITEKSSAQCTDNVRDITRFDPEMALAAMGEGQPITVSESSHIPYQSSISQSNPSSEPNSTFDAEMALAAIGDEESVQNSTSAQGSHSNVNTNSFQLQCAPDLGLADSSMDVSLDESGSELDFEALSEEFNRSTRHR